MKLTVAVLQYDVPGKTGDLVTKLNKMTEKATRMGAKLVVAPETAIGDALEVKETEIDYLPLLMKAARKNKVYLSTSFYKKERGKYFNQGYIVSSDGRPVLEHKKIYPAKPEIENIGVVGGNDLKVTGTEIGKLGMLICKDGFNKHSHFLYERLGELGAEIICIPAWSLGWKELNTQEYVKALYLYGAFTGRAYVLMSGNLNKWSGSFGKSLIISPVRGVLKEGSTDKEEILVEELDLGEVKKARDFDFWWQPKERVILK